MGVIDVAVYMESRTNHIAKFPGLVPLWETFLRLTMIVDSER